MIDVKKLDESLEVFERGAPDFGDYHQGKGLFDAEIKYNNACNVIEDAAHELSILLKGAHPELVLMPRAFLNILTPFEMVSGDSIKRTDPHSNVNLNFNCTWAVSNGRHPAYKVRSAIIALNSAADPKQEEEWPG